MDAHELGRQGERLAQDMLKQKGFCILSANYRCRAGEIDIVARKGGVVYFVEVKSRRSRRFGTPTEAVDGRKRRRVRQAAATYLQEHRPAATGYRFAVFAAEYDESGKNAKVQWVEDPFYD